MSGAAALRDRPEIAVTRGPLKSLHPLHRILMRAYQARYIVLPSLPSGASVIAELDRRYDPIELAQLDAARPALERALIAPAADAAIRSTAGADVLAYADSLLPRLRAEPENAFISFLRSAPEPEPHYRNFLLQSSADLLAEASASAFGVIGAFGAPQSALFRILIDEFGYGMHDRKHSVLYQAVMRNFGLCDAYGAYEALFDTSSLELHNTIHWLFQNPRNVFLQAGFLLFAETAYQRSTADHYRYLREFYPAADARYFGEHAHIDLHHTRMVINDVAGAYVARYGAEAGAEIVAGAELTRMTFDRAGAHLLAVSQAFTDAVARGEARYVAPTVPPSRTPALSPLEARSAIPGTRLQVGGLGQVSAAAFASFPDGATGLLLNQGMTS
jgi:hypothetical protein